MNSLFLKIFLWFWTAFVIVGVTLVVVVAVTRSNTTMLAGLSVYLPFEARQATYIYERDGKSALQRHFDHLSEMGLAKPYLLDENWNDVLGRTPPAQAVEFAKVARSDAALVRKFKGWKAVAAQQVVGEGGHKYTIMAIMSRPPVVGVIKDLGYKTLLGLLAVLLVGAPFCFLLACHIANPIVRLSEAAGRIADGWLNTRSGQSIRSRGDEIGRLGVSFDRMAERIESLVRGQQRLFGDISHELRSPLARLSVAEGLLRQCPPEERTEYLDRIALEVEHLDQLIGQFLTLARINSGADSSRIERVELNSLIQEVAVDGNFEARAKCCAVRVDSENQCTTTGAREQLRRAIENVVRNAIRYTQPSTEVEITIREQRASAISRAVIQVRDHGPGVSSEHLEKIFLPFYRIPTINGESTNGAGLGLAITDRIVRMYGGSVSAANALDGGLIVNLELSLT
ncbi:MAG: two-component system, OmpR family, sensor histidine kinase CpxA, partial [Acidobacteriaceae bacterium]|nr:two-component system, OmpR family, sensor histidine kinase CpxA [Acidobacteriaceae bacterium]